MSVSTTRNLSGRSFELQSCDVHSPEANAAGTTWNPMSRKRRAGENPAGVQKNTVAEIDASECFSGICRF
jgi:hypothetical protein